MLSDLKVLNGTLDLEFDESIYNYTILVDDSITSLELLYETKNNEYVVVRNNNIVDFENFVYIDVYAYDRIITYTLCVYKENSNQVSGIDSYLNSLEVQKTDNVTQVEMQCLSIGVFLGIVIIFSIIFKRKKSHFN